MTAAEADWGRPSMRMLPLGSSSCSNRSSSSPEDGVAHGPGSRQLWNQSWGQTAYAASRNVTRLGFPV